ncbi:MAG: diacylglycerol kinase family lipid kinase [Spirochaetaceae bacterium]|nr:MAG: diacylglycerol kinase family lipid kinase [Spirochaetaceae bacterium]
MKLCLIVNPNAGRKAGSAVAARVATLLADAGIETERFVSDGPGGTRRIAESIDPGGCDGIVTVGGDGSFFEVINGLLAHADSIRVPLGVVPVGTGNSFIRDLGITSPEEAVERIIAGTTRRVDLGRFACDVGAYWFANLLGAGFVSNVAHRAKRVKGLGSLSYILAVIGEVMRLESTPIVLEIDGLTIEREAIFVEVCNSRYTGGSMMMAPGARIDDGLFDVIVAGSMSRLTVMKLLPKIFSGAHVESPDIQVFTGRSVRLRAAKPLALTPDGETFGSTPIDVSMHAGMVEIYGS